MRRKTNETEAGNGRQELEEAVDWDRDTIEIRSEVYRKLSGWKEEAFPYGCSWTTFVHHLISEKEQRYLDGAPERIDQLKLLDEETYIRKSQERRYDSLVFSPEGRGLMIDDDFYRRYRRQIEAIYHHTEGHVDRTRIANELRRYMEEYGIDAKTACEAIARKWAFYDEEEHHPRFVLDPGDPSPSFALDALEADIFTSLLTRARPKTVAKYMKELGYDETIVESHMPLFIKKWRAIRDIEWANLLIMKHWKPEEN